MLVTVVRGRGPARPAPRWSLFFGSLLVPAGQASASGRPQPGGARERHRRRLEPSPRPSCSGSTTTFARGHVTSAGRVSEAPRRNDDRCGSPLAHLRNAKGGHGARPHPVPVGAAPGTRRLPAGTNSNRCGWPRSHRCRRYNQKKCGSASRSWNAAPRCARAEITAAMTTAAPLCPARTPRCACRSWGPNLDSFVRRSGPASVVAWKLGPPDRCYLAGSVVPSAFPRSAASSRRSSPCPVARLVQAIQQSPPSSAGGPSRPPKRFGVELSRPRPEWSDFVTRSAPPSSTAPGDPFAGDLLADGAAGRIWMPARWSATASSQPEARSCPCAPSKKKKKKKKRPGFVGHPRALPGDAGHGGARECRCWTGWRKYRGGRRASSRTSVREAAWRRSSSALCLVPAPPRLESFELPISRG